MGKNHVKPNRGNFKDIEGQRFGRWIVVEYCGIMPNSSVSAWKCRCDCGTIKIIKAASLQSGRSQSCGCRHKEIVAAVGRSRAGLRKRHPVEYACWNQMLQRCHNPNNPTYERYGAKGIRVCARWRRGFEEFFKDMGSKPTPEHTLDRIKSDQDYKPVNCQWLHKSLQARNRLYVKRYTINGEKLCIPEISKKYNIKERTIYWRIKKGWSMDRVVGIDPKTYHSR